MSTVELNKTFFEFLSIEQILNLLIFVCLSSLDELTNRVFKNLNMKRRPVQIRVVEFVSFYIEGY